MKRWKEGCQRGISKYLYKYLRFIITRVSEASFKWLWIDQVSDPSLTYLLRSCQPHPWPEQQQEVRIFPPGGLLLTTRTKCLPTIPPRPEEQSLEQLLVVPRLSMKELSLSIWGILRWLELLLQTSQQSQVVSCLFTNDRTNLTYRRHLWVWEEGCW